MSHYVYLVRHGEQRDAEHGVVDSPLSERGRRQSELLAERLRGVEFTRALTSPLDRSRQTAEILADRLAIPSLEESTLLFDCIPSGMDDDTPAIYQRFFAGIPVEDVEAGAAQMSDAADAFLERTRGDEHTLLITHNFVIGALVRTALDMPEWRWLGLNSLNCAVTVLRIRSTKPSELLVFNDASHLPRELRTGATQSALPI